MTYNFITNQGENNLVDEILRVSVCECVCVCGLLAVIHCLIMRAHARR